MYNYRLLERLGVVIEVLILDVGEVILLCFFPSIFLFIYILLTLSDG